MKTEYKSLPIYTLDIETDPFKEGRFPVPFSAGFYDGVTFTYYWGSDCLQRMRKFVESQPPGIIYAHNGGRFDVYYLMDWIAGNPMRVINSRIIAADMVCDLGVHSFRDSYAIMPFALGSYKGKKQKLEIDIRKLEASVREKNKQEILEYLEMDCVLLHELCSAFHFKFGDKLTIGSTAMKELGKIHSFEKLDASWDKFIRGGRMCDFDFKPSKNEPWDKADDFEAATNPVYKQKIKKDRSIRHGYYYGGRVECFAKGVVYGDFKIYDVNSMYPFVMKSMQHPIGKVSLVGKTVTDNTCFVKVKGRNYGAFPMRSKDGLNFNVKYGIFHVTIHEYLMALKYKLFRPDEILLTIDFYEQGTFAEFVDKFYSARLEAKAMDDACNEMFYKLILNSAYGKFSQNPDRYEDNVICRAGWENAPGDQCTCKLDDCECGGWAVKEMSTLFEDHHENYWVWRCNSKDYSRFNVATGASITGASRSLLMEAIHLATRPVYTDTDCVVCEALPTTTLDGKQLGAWKLEGEGNSMAVAGKKLYALFDDDAIRNQAREVAAKKAGKKKQDDGRYMEYSSSGLQCVKKANKGVRVTAQEILEVAQGETITARRDAPSFSLSGNFRFIKRDVRMT